LNWKRFVTGVKYRLGLATPEELLRDHLPHRERLIAELPLEQRESIRALTDRMHQLSTAADLPQFFNCMREMSAQFDMAARTLNLHPELASEETRRDVNLIAASDLWNYRPAGAKIWNFFPNAFMVYSFFGEMHYAVAAAIALILMEVRHDGYTLRYGKNVSPERVVEVRKQLERLKLKDYRLLKLKHRLVYGNDFTIAHRSLFNPDNIARLELLVPDRLTPRFDRITEKIVGWDYKLTQVSSMFYSNSELIHGKSPSLRYPEIGIAPISSCIVDLEADLAASALNSTIFQKAGMIGVIIAMEDPSAQNNLNLKASDRLVKKLAQRIKEGFSGVQGGMSVLVSNFIKDVHKVADLGKLDANFLQFRKEVAKMLCIILQIPISTMDIGGKSDGVYEAASAMENEQAHRMDKAIAARMEEIDTDINEDILKKKMNIFDIEIEANGRFGSFTLNAANAALIATKIGPLFTVNRILKRFFGEPGYADGDPLGDLILDNRDPMKIMPPQIAPEDPRERAEDDVEEEPEVEE
jgi:hypothetical protein